MFHQKINGVLNYFYKRTSAPQYYIFCNKKQAKVKPLSHLLCHKPRKLSIKKQST